MEENKKNIKKKRKLKKKGFIVIIILLIITIISLSTVLVIHNKEVKEVKSYYSKTITLKKKSGIYYKNKKIGKNLEEIKLDLESIKGKYFKVKNTDYYIYYKNAKKNKKEDKKEDNSNYVVFNKNIKSNKKVTLYKEDKKIITLNNINTPIEAIDKDNYYISFLNDTYIVKKDKSIKEIKSNNTKEKMADHVSVLFYEFITDPCNDYNCTTTENFVSGKKNLKEKAIYINTANYTEHVSNLNKELGINVEKIDEDAKFRYISTYKAAKANSDLKRIDRYQIKTYTSIDDVLKMANGEEIKQSTPEEVNNQGVAVLNYHFFYDARVDVCGESICLDSAKFREHLQYLKDNNFKTLTMEEFRKWMYGEIEIPSKSILLTVDDGAKGTGKHNGNQLNPLLEEYKLNATLFLITGWWGIDNYESDYLDIQSHTHDMHQYGPCGRGQINCYGYAAAKQDLENSLTVVKNNDSFCFPFYMTSSESLRAVKDVGFKLAFVGGNVKAKRTNDKWLIPRYPIMDDITLDQFIYKVN